MCGNYGGRCLAIDASSDWSARPFNVDLAASMTINQGGRAFPSNVQDNADMRWMRWIATSALFVIVLVFAFFGAVLSGLAPLKLSYDLLERRICRVLFLDNCAPTAPLAEVQVTINSLSESGFRIVLNGNLRNIGAAKNYEQLIGPNAVIVEDNSRWRPYTVRLTQSPLPKIAGDGRRGVISLHIDTSGFGRDPEWAELRYSIESRPVDVGLGYRDWSAPDVDVCPPGFSPEYQPRAHEVNAPAVVIDLELKKLPSVIGSWEDLNLDDPVRNVFGKLLVIGMKDPVFRLGGDSGPDPWLEFSIFATYQSLQTLADQISPKRGYGQRRGVRELVWLLLIGDQQAHLDLSRFPRRLSSNIALNILPGEPGSTACVSGLPDDSGRNIMMAD